MKRPKRTQAMLAARAEKRAAAWQRRNQHLYAQPGPDLAPDLTAQLTASIAAARNRVRK